MRLMRPALVGVSCGAPPNRSAALYICARSISMLEELA
jgi:hypothetical protein